MLSQHEELLNRLYPLFAALPQMQAIGLGGSLRAALNDSASDIEMSGTMQPPALKLM